MIKLLPIYILFKTLVYAYVIKDILENESQTPANWMLENNAIYTSTTLCAESRVGPYLGLLNSNVKKIFSNIRPHFSITFSLDIYYTEYWGTAGNYFEIILDGTKIFDDSNIMTLSLSSPSTYCSTNDILYQISFKNRGLPKNSQLITIQSQMLHENANYLLEVKGSFLCVELLPLQFFCEKVGIKNLYIYIEECHESCLTCSGPLSTNCLTCPQGLVTSGKCSCGALFVSQNQCVASCPANQEMVSGYCVESCGTSCLNCANQICSSCQVGFFLYQGKCVISCPSYSVINGFNCDDLMTISSFGSEYLGKYFYTLETNIVNDLAPFTFTSSSGNSLLTRQKYCIYGNLFMLGGLGVWADGIFRISYNTLSPHNKIRILMKVYFIDSWNGEEFVVRVDGVQVYSNMVVSSSQTLNLMFRDAKDRIEPITLTLPHLSSSLMIEFESKLTQSAFIASAGITDLFILIDYCDISCAVCGTTQCTLCLSPYTLITNQCIICGSSNSRNSNCSCKDGYFDDSQINCQQCPIQCSSCLSLTNCLNCNSSGHFSNLPYCSDCESGYYYTSSNDCQQCISNCKVCDNSETCYQCQERFYQNSSYTCTECSQNCKSCDISGCQICETNFALNSELKCVKCNSNETVIAGYCQQCKSQCLTCLEQLDNCQSCPFPRINPPNCKCQDGYFESSDQCQNCHQFCATCELSQTNCLSCAANRINIPKCDCPTGGISQIERGIIWCSTCESAVLEIYFSDDLRSLIIDFGVNLYKDEYLNCSQIFMEETVNLLGFEPTCYTYLNQLKILLDYNATINLNNEINFKDSTLFTITNCLVPIKYFLNNQVGPPKTSIVPEILFNFQQTKYISGLKIDVQIIEELITGMRKLNLEEWRFLPCNINCQNSNILLKLNKQINQTQFEISNYDNELDTNLVLALYFHNFLGISGYQTIELIVLNKEIELICNVAFPKQPFYQQNASYDILLYPYLYDGNQQIQISENMNVTLMLQLYIQSVLVQSFSLNSTTNSYSILKLETQNLLINEKYNLRITAADNLEFEFSQQMQFIVHEKNPILYIVGGNRQIGYNQLINLEAILINNSTQLLPKWNCLNLGNSKSCNDQDENLIQLNNSFTNTLKPSTFPPYTAYQFNILVENNNIKSSDSVIVMTIEDNIPQILLSSNTGIKSGVINYYDMIYLNFTYTDISTNPDLLLYVGTFYYNLEIINQVQFKYLDIVMSLWDYLDSNQFPNLHFKFTIYNANYLMPSTYNFKLSINVPPQNCNIQSNITQGFSLIDYFEITVLNCQDEDQPLQYKFIVYYSEADIQQDYSLGNVVKGQKLNQFGYQNQLISHLTGNNSIIIMVIVKDQLEGISNYTLNLNIVQQNQLVPDYSNILKEIMLNSIVKSIIRDISIMLKHFEIFNSFSLQNLQEIYDYLSILQENQLLDATDQKDILLLYSQLYSFGLIVNYQKINSQFLQINENLANIYDSIIVIRSDNDSQNYNLNQLSQKQLNEQIQQSANILNNLQSANLNIKRTQRRLLVEDDINQNKQLFLNSLSLIESSLSTQQVVNSNTLTVNQSEFQIHTSKLSQKQLELQVGPISSQTDQYKYSETKITTNPYYQDNDFKQLTDGTPNALYMPNLTQIRSNDPITQLDTKINYIFDITKQQLQDDKVFECVSKISDIWSVDVCNNVKNDIGQMICQCSQISPITLIDAALELTDNFISLFSLNTLLRIQQYDFSSDIFTYTLIVETIIFLIIFIRCHILDQKQNQVENISKVTPITDSNPKEIIQIKNLVKEENKPENTPNQRRLIRSSTKHITENKIPLDYVISNQIKIRTPTLYRFNSKSALQKKSKLNQIDQIEEKIKIKSQLTLQQQPNLQHSINMMVENSPNSILRKPINSNDNQRNLKLNYLNDKNTLLQLNENLNSSNNNSPKPSMFNKIGQVYTKNNDENIIFESAQNSPPNQESQQRKNEGLITEVNQNGIGLSISILQYIKYHHKFLNILYRQDPQNPRITRATLMYVSILGQMAILTFFGKVFILQIQIMNLNTVLALSILSSIFGFVYKTLISYSIKSQNKILNYFGFNLSIISFFLFYFIILASVSKYQSKQQSNFWGLAFLSNQFLDLVVYALIMQIVYFTMFVRYGTKPFIKKIGKIILPAEEFELFYGVQTDNVEGEKTENR